MEIRLTQSIPCSVCGSYDNHKPNCEIATLERLQSYKTRISCPKCPTGKIELNADDLYECRECHTQFCTSRLSDREKPEEIVLFDSKRYDAIIVMVWETKGRGNFPIDRAISEIQARIAEKTH